MVLDTSALVAILFEEPEHGRLKAAIALDPRRDVSAATLLEAGMVLESRAGEVAGRELDLLLRQLACRVVPVDEPQAERARAGWRSFGKGRHPAGLNFGDCFAYALSMTSGEPLLFKGDDFSRTDVPCVDY